MEGKGRIIVSQIVAVMMLSGGFLLLTGSEEADGYIEELITPFGYRQRYPAVDGIYLVYEDFAPSGSRIILRNIRTGVESRIVNFESWAPDISGDRIVFLSDRDGQWDIYEYRISTTNWAKITDNAVVEYAPRVDGENIVWWEDQGGSDLSVMHYSPGTGITKLSSYSGSDFSPNIHGNLVVWQCNEYGYHIIRGYDLSRSQEMDIFDNVGNDLRKPDIYGDRVVYVQQSGLNDLVWVFNITTKTACYVSDFNYRSDWPRIDREHIVYLTAYDSGWDVAMYDILTGMESRLTFDSAPDWYPVVWGEHIAYSKDSGTSHVYYILMDYDDDGIPDQKDMFPYDPHENFDTDGDGRGDNIDPDNDNDGVVDEEDAFPYDDTEWDDFDGDGIGDNADPDDDNDNIEDNDDPFPYSDINPIMDYLMILMERLYDMEQNLSGRLDDLEATLTALLEENEEDIMNGIMVAVVDLNDTLSGLNLSDDTDAIIANITDIYTHQPDWYDPVGLVESFFDVVTDIVVDLEVLITGHMGNITNDLGETNQNVGELMEAMEALNEIEGIASNLEQVGMDIRAQNEDIDTTDQNMRTYFIVLIILMVIYLVILIFLFVRISRKDIEGSGEY